MGKRSKIVSAKANNTYRTGRDFYFIRPFITSYNLWASLPIAGVLYRDRHLSVLSR